MIYMNVLEVQMYYIFMDILSPIKDLMQSERGWDSTAFGTMQGSETFLNVFIFFLIFAGIILDKMGVRFTAAGFILGVVMLPRIRKHLDAEHLCKGSVLGVMVFLAYWSNSTGLTDTTASNSSFLTSLYCVIIPFLGWALRGPRPTRFNLAAAMVCVAGVECVSFAGADGFSLRFGDLITLRVRDRGLHPVDLTHQNPQPLCRIL